MLIKDRVNFKIMVNKDFNFFDVLTYTVTVLFTIDHDKFWDNAPNHSEEYTDYVNSLDDIHDEIESLIPYVIHDGEIIFNIRYEHYNTDVYEPLLDYLGDKGFSYVVHFTEYRPNLEIAISDLNYKDTSDKIYPKFNMDNVLMYSE